MNFEIKFLHENLSESMKKDILEILHDSDNDFYPPLSSRSCIFQKSFQINECNKENINDYYRKIINQPMILAISEEGRVAGFMTFRNDYSCEEIKCHDNSNYITTICISKEFRNKGITKILYNFIEEGLPTSYKRNAITVRTWSTNHSHMGILSKLNFKQLSVLEHHRGEGVHTVYFGKKINKVD